MFTDDVILNRRQEILSEVKDYQENLAILYDQLNYLCNQCNHTDIEKKYYSCAGHRAVSTLCKTCGKELSWRNMDEDDED